MCANSTLCLITLACLQCTLCAHTTICVPTLHCAHYTMCACTALCVPTLHSVCQNYTLCAHCALHHVCPHLPAHTTLCVPTLHYENPHFTDHSGSFVAAHWAELKVRHRCGGYSWNWHRYTGNGPAKCMGKQESPHLLHVSFLENIWCCQASCKCWRFWYPKLEKRECPSVCLFAPASVRPSVCQVCSPTSWKCGLQLQ